MSTCVVLNLLIEYKKREKLETCRALYRCIATSLVNSIIQVR